MDSALPLNHQEMLYRELAEIMDRTRLALQETDPDVLMLLAEDQTTVVKELQNAGISADSRLLVQVQALSRQVSDVIEEIQQCQHEVSTRIKQASDGRKLVHAYVA
jgi:hypothetical protein